MTYVHDWQVLMQFELVPKETHNQRLPPPPSICPEFEDAEVLVTVLGLRRLKGLEFYDVTRPSIELCVGGARATNKRVATKKSNTPSSHDPNFMEQIRLPVRLPVNPLFAPRLDIAAVDSLLGGFYSPTLGT